MDEEASDHRDYQQRSGGKGKRLYDFSTSDFATLVNTTAFVDRSRMIKSVFTCSSKILVTAPRRFGKSTNIDMMKRFLEIVVDVNGAPKAVNTTKNYQLFTNNNLEICKDGKVISEHFGKHPVIHIDLLPLVGMCNFEDTVDAFKTIISNTFYEHRYLLHADRQNLCMVEDFSAEDFRKFVSDRLIEDVGVADLLYSFKHLSRLLCTYFEKQVFVLIDNYDALVSSMTGLVYNGNDVRRTNYFKGKIIDNLLYKNLCVERAFLTGTLPLIVESEYARHGSYIHIYSFMDSHYLSKYYGLSSRNFEKILSLIIHDDAEKNVARGAIDEFYSGYVTGSHSIHLCNTWSVLHYLHRGKARCYWSGCERLQRLEPFFKNSQIRDSIEKLLLGESQLVDRFHELSSADISELNDVIARGEVEEHLSCSVVRTCFVVLYHSGYLSIHKLLSWGSAYLKIPNVEIKNELVRILLQSNTGVYNWCQNFSDEIRIAVDSIQPDMDDDRHEVFNKLHKGIRNWYVLIQEGKDFSTFLFMILCLRPYYSQLMAHRRSDDEMIILLKNEHDVAICITAHRTPFGKLNENTVMAHEHFTRNSDYEGFFNQFTDVRGKVIIAICYNEVNRTIATTYSYYLKEGDSLKNHCTISPVI